MPYKGKAHYTKCLCCDTPKTFTVSEQDYNMQSKHSFNVVNESGKYTTRYTSQEVYKIVVNYPHTHRTLEFVGMDRGSCIMQAEVAKQPGDDLMLMQSEETITVLNKEKI
jgi:hypothetical protein